MTVIDLVQSRLRMRDAKLGNIVWNRQSPDARPHSPAQVVKTPRSYFVAKGRVDALFYLAKTADRPLAAGCRKDKRAGPAGQGLQELNGRRSQRHLVRRVTFHSLRGNDPQRFFKINLGP